MHRLLIAAASAALLVAVAAPVLADDYPPCTHKDQDHCRVVPMMMHGHHHPMAMHHAKPMHHPKPMDHHK